MKLNITEINYLASIANRIDNAINNANTEMETLKQYVIETVNKCRANIKEMTSFIEKNKNLFWVGGNTYPHLKPVNGLYSWYGSEVKYIVDGYDDFVIKIDTISCEPKLERYRGESQHRFDKFNYEENNTNIEYWYDMKKRTDDYKKYMELFITKFESMVKCIVSKKLAHMQSIVDATNEVVQDQPIVKEIKIVVVT